jgi:SecD/SecF fusion protein
MSKGRRPLLMLLMVIGLTAASLVAIALRPAVLGLDLQGGVEVILEGRPTAESPVTPEAIERSVEVIRSRVDAFGVAEPEIQTQGSDQIVVALPGVDNPQRVVTDLIKPAQLAFYDFQENVEGNPSPNLYQTVKRAQRIDPENPRRGAETLYAFRKGTNRLVAGPVIVTEGERREALVELREDVEAADVRWNQVNVESVPRGLVVVSETRPVLETRPDGAQRTEYYIFQDNRGLTGRDITGARQLRDVSGSGDPIVTMDFTDAGQDKFQEITQGLALRGSSTGELQSFAIVLDGLIVSNPTVDYRDYPNGIDGSNGAQIQGNFTVDSARTLANQLNSGAIPIRLEPISQKRVSATIGEESLRKSLIAGIVGLILVALFLIGYYRFLGVIACLGLLIYAALFYAAVVLVPITLTLPGIAGVILTIGVAADANIVIFERVREEARAGKSAGAALSAGYRKGIAAIIDANIVTLLTAAIVFLFATGGPRGFAFTLAIGVILSLFTAVIGTRAIFGVLLGSRLMRDDKVMSLNAGRVPRFDWVGRWKLWLVLSTAPVIIGLVWLGATGLNLGLDFESGTRISTTFEREVSETDLRETMADLGFPNAKIQETQETVGGREVTGFQIQTESLNPEEQTRVERELDAAYGFNEDTLSLEQVGPTFGEQVIRNAIQAIILSFIVVALYLIIRFEYKLALPAMVSVVHDVALCIGVYAVTGREVTSATVAALLTILGYSLYDVVIVFDRIRENVPYMRGARYRDIVNRSVNETFTRSCITSLTTLLPVLALFFFGGETLSDFSFALLVGVLSGSISSIVIAAPLASFWKEREPAERKRQARDRKRALASTADADVVDVAVLQRAEQALHDEFAGRPAGVLEAPETAQATLAPPEPVDAPQPEDDVDEAAYEAFDTVPGDGTPEPDGGDGDGRATETAPPRAQDRPARERRHRNVQRKRR